MKHLNREVVRSSYFLAATDEDKLTLSFGNITSQRCQDRNILDNTRQFAMVFQAPLVSQKDNDHE